MKHYTDRINPSSWVDLRSEDPLASVAVRIPVELNQLVSLEASLESRDRGRKSQLALPLTGPSE